MHRTIPPGAILALLVLGSCRPSGDSPAPGTVRELLMNFQVTGTITNAGPIADPMTGLPRGFWMEALFSGPMRASRADDTDGRVASTPGLPLGEFGPARVRFTFDFGSGAISSDTARFACLDCRIAFDDGSVLRPVARLNDPMAQRSLDIPSSETDVPLEGRFLIETAPVVGAALGLRLRGAGCGGNQEVAGRGALAGMKGTICMNGVFTFPDLALPSAPDEIDAFLTKLLTSPLVGSGESDCTITAHVPRIDVP